MIGPKRLLSLAAAACAVAASMALPASAAAFAPYLVPPTVPPPPTAAAAQLLKGASVAAQDGWMVVRLHGRPYRIGFQNGYLAAQSSHYFILYDLGPRGNYWRVRGDTIARKIVWPLIPLRFKQELRGIADGMHAAGYTKDTLWDVVAANDWADQWVYGKRVPFSNTLGEAPLVGSASRPRSATPLVPGQRSGMRCSAFVATGSATSDGRPVMGHNTWSGYDGSFMYNVMFYVHPDRGYDFTYDAAGGQIWSGNDWYVNSAGLLLCETTIVWDTVCDATKQPIFIRARQAAQFARTVGQAVRFFTHSSNGAYANEWLIADATGQIASLQLGCRAHDLHTTRDGFFGSCNYTWGRNILKEAHHGVATAPNPPSARWIRWGQLKQQNWGAIDAASGMAMLSDTYDVEAGKIQPDGRTICGECENSLAGVAYDGPWVWGAFDGKVATESMALDGLKQWARWGHPNGDGFDAAKWMASNPKWAKDYGAFSVFGLQTFSAQTPNPWTLMQQ